MSHRLAQLVRLMAVPSLLALATMTAPAVYAGSPCFHGYVVPPTTTGPGTDVKLMPCSFEPTITTVAVGAEVTFHSGPDYTHLITGANQAWGSRDVELQPNSTISYTFDEPGIYPYACALHVGMSGAIVVGDPDEAAAAGSTNGSTTGGTTGAAADTSGAAANDTAGAAADTSGATEAAAADTTTAAASSGLPLLALGAIAGLIVGAGALWLAIRRRSPGDRSLVHADPL